MSYKTHLGNYENELLVLLQHVIIALCLLASGDGHNKQGLLWSSSDPGTQTGTDMLQCIMLYCLLYTSPDKSYTLKD